MKVYVDPETCTGCELCVGMCPEVFEIQGMVSVAKVNPVPVELEASAREAAESCPVEAIKIE